MAKCAICQTPLHLWDPKVKISDGVCCGKCSSKAGGISSKYSSNDVRRKIEHFEACKQAGQKIKSFYKIKCKELGCPEGDSHLCVTTSDKYYLCWIQKKILYLVEYETDYLCRFDIFNQYSIEGTWMPLAEVENLVPIDLTYIAIPIKDILSFSKEGQLQYTTKISGGGGGGSSVSGAIAGGLIAGGTGAIIGSRQKINPIKSTTEVHGDPKTVLKYYDGDELKAISFISHYLYDYFLEKMPEKDIMTPRNQPPEEKSADATLKEKLQMVKSLYEEGLIDEDEYTNKKQELLQQF